MFQNIGWGEFLILAVAGLVILGPERLPDAMKWTMGALKQVREYATGATDSLKAEMGTDFEEFREPLAELQKLRGMGPRAAVTKHLLGGDDSILTNLESQVGDIKASLGARPAAAGVQPQKVQTQKVQTQKIQTQTIQNPPPVPGAPNMTKSAPANSGARPRFDPDAT